MSIPKITLTKLLITAFLPSAMFACKCSIFAEYEFTEQDKVAQMSFIAGDAGRVQVPSSHEAVLI